jgi:mRNA interferase MazF
VRVPLRHGSVVWVDLNPTRGREQQGNRPALIVSGEDYLASVPGLVVVLPITSVDRGWAHHVEVTSARLPSKSFAMTEQPRTISTERVARQSGVADARTMDRVRQWLRDFLDL